MGGEDISHLSIDQGYQTDVPPSDASSFSETAKTANLFTATEALDIYKPVENFEGAHRFEPAAQWADEEEQKLVRKVRKLYRAFLSDEIRLTTKISSTGELPYLCASCSLPCSWIAATSPKLWRTISSVRLFQQSFLFYPFVPINTQGTIITNQMTM